MAAPTKTATALTGLGATAPGVTNSSQWVNCTTYFEMVAALNATWSGTTTSGPTVTINVSPDNGTTVYVLAILQGPPGSSPWNVPPIEVPDAAMYVQVQCKNTDTTITVTFAGHVTHIDTVA